MISFYEQFTDHKQRLCSHADEIDHLARALSIVGNDHLACQLGKIAYSIRHSMETLDNAAEIREQSDDE